MTREKNLRIFAYPIRKTYSSWLILLEDAIILNLVVAGVKDIFVLVSVSEASSRTKFNSSVCFC